MFDGLGFLDRRFWDGGIEAVYKWANWIRLLARKWPGIGLLCRVILQGTTYIPYSVYNSTSTQNLCYYS